MNRPDPSLTRRAVLAAGLGAAALPPSVLAQSWPSKPVRMIVPLPAGGATDALARLLGQKLEAMWGQTVLVDNRGGAGTIVGTQAVARAPADGYTFGMVISAHTINPVLRDDLPYDTLKDFTPLTQFGNSLIAFVAHPSLAANDVAGVIKEAKAKPGQVSYASLGVGTGTHLAGELLNKRTGIDLLHVPYNGSAPAYNDLLAGRVPLAFVTLQSALPHIRSGKLKMLGLTTAQRSKAFPQYPTVAETVSGFAVDSLIGFVAPRGLPTDVAQKLSRDIIAVAKAKETEERLSELGAEAVGSSPQEFEAFLRAEMEKWRPLVKASGAQVK